MAVQIFRNVGFRPKIPILRWFLGGATPHFREHSIREGGKKRENRNLKLKRVDASQLKLESASKTKSVLFSCDFPPLTSGVGSFVLCCVRVGVFLCVFLLSSVFRGGLVRNPIFGFVPICPVQGVWGRAQRGSLVLDLFRKRDFKSSQRDGRSTGGAARLFSALSALGPLWWSI